MVEYVKKIGAVPIFPIQVYVNIIVGKEIGPSLESRLENIFVIYE